VESYKIQINRGTTFRRAIRPEDEHNGVFTPEDLTGCVVSFQVNDPDTSVPGWNCDHSESVTVDPDGWINLYMSADETRRYSRHRRYEYFVDVIHGSGDEERILYGNAYFN
jgi:hypothetical protein